MQVDGRAAPATGTVLEACLSVGVDVPHFCHSGEVSSGGHCRSCMVEMDGRHVASCTTQARPGATIRTDTDTLRAYRRDLGELMLAEARPGGPVAAALAGWGADGSRYAAAPCHTPADASHPYLRLDPDACIRCRLCERACEGIQGQFVYSFVGRGAETRLSWGEGSFAATDCVSCGACATVCPTGAISDRDRQRAETIPEARRVQTTCGYCGVGCQLDVHVGADDRVLRIDGTADAKVNDGHLCVKGRYAHAFSRHPERLRTPLVRKDGVLVPVSWEEAIETVAREMNRLRGHVAAVSSSRCTNEENYLLQKWMRAGMGTNNVDCCARVCHGPTAAGMRRVLGTGAATNSLEDIERADCILVSGSNATDAHPVTGARIKQRVLSGAATLVVIDPRRTELAALADVHLQLRPGSNVPLLNALAHALVKLDRVDHAYIAARTEGWESYLGFLDAFSPEATEAVTGVPAERVWTAARLYGTAHHPLQAHGLGMTEHYQGSESVMLLCNLALLVGAIGREGVGVNPLRGQNNVQGAADMGCQPDLLTGYQNPTDPTVRARFAAVWGRPVPTDVGLTIPRMYDAARAGTLKALYIFGEDIVQTDPECHVAGALEALEFVVVQELFLTETAKRAHVVLPGASFLEKDGTFTNGERRIQRVRRALDPVEGSRPDWEILCALMGATGCPQPFRSPADIMDEIAQVNPAFTGVHHHRLDHDGLQWPVPAEDHPGTARLHAERFPVGKARLAEVPFLPSPSLAMVSPERWPLRLVTGRVLEHYNCGSMTRRSPNVELVAVDALELHPVDAARAGVVDGSAVRVRSPWGEARATACITDRVSEGTAFLAFHFPETATNALMSPVLDRIADCPEYKVTPVRVEPG
jgi:formate dehydrogenase alpha subunit